jgi:hypothetical protein
MTKLWGLAVSVGIAVNCQVAFAADLKPLSPFNRDAYVYAYAESSEHYYVVDFNVRTNAYDLYQVNKAHPTQVSKLSEVQVAHFLQYPPVIDIYFVRDGKSGYLHIPKVPGADLKDGYGGRAMLVISHVREPLEFATMRPSAEELKTRLHRLYDPKTLSKFESRGKLPTIDADSGFLSCLIRKFKPH